MRNRPQKHMVGNLILCAVKKFFLWLQKKIVVYLRVYIRDTKRQKPNVRRTTVLYIYIYMYSVLILQKGMHLFRIVQLVSVKVRPSAPLREDKYPQMLSVLGLLCIVLMETSFHINLSEGSKRPPGPTGFCLLVCVSTCYQFCSF